MATYGSEARFEANNQGFQVGQNTGPINVNYISKPELVTRRD